MERLSGRAIAIINNLYTDKLNYGSKYLPLVNCALKCLDYEATGLDPDEVAAKLAELEALKRDYNEAKQTICELCRKIAKDAVNLCGCASCKYGLIKHEREDEQ